jgi:fructan beta-fructosidase
MLKTLVIIICLFICEVGLAQDKLFYQERFRPQFHFTPPIHWTNDPNGLVYHKGEYHLFYQFNPFGNRWGHMSWGHAVSKDLIRWQHLPLAIPEANDTMIFSGSCVVDKHNTSGFGKLPGQIPMVAIYTAHRPTNQAQHIAYSLDDGRTWTKYDRNPVLDLNNRDFRDPKVFWYEPHSKWIMAVVLAWERKVQFYSSTNLAKWELMSSFGPAGDTSGVWECPDLFEVPVLNQPGKTKWVLVNSPFPYMQYFIGEFDGSHFKNENDTSKICRPDYGPDYYAAIAFNNLPAGIQPITIGWANNWNYANDIPTTPWKSAMSLPRSLAVKNVGGEWILVQQPVAAIRQLRTQPFSTKNIKVKKEYLLPLQSQSCELEVTFKPATTSISGIRMAKGKDQYVEIGYDAAKEILYVDRSKSGDTCFHSSFGKLSRYETSLKTQNGTIKLRVFFDKSIVEVFANDGEVVLTTQIFPPEKNNAIALFSNGVDVVFESTNSWVLKSVW